MTTRKSKAGPDAANRPRVHTDIEPDAAALRWTNPQPPWHAPGDVIVQLPHDAPEAIRVDGVFVNPGEIAWVNEESAKAFPQLTKPRPEMQRLREMAKREKAQGS